jgi:hypothetical protein
VTDIDTLIRRLSFGQRRHFSLWCAGRAIHLMSDPRFATALDVSARHQRGEATEWELDAAMTAAWSAAGANAERFAEKVARVVAIQSWCPASAGSLAAADACFGKEYDAERTAQHGELERMLKGAKP